MRAAARAFDTTRPITMNNIVVQALPYLDVQGMSHRTGAHMDSWHQANPTKPLMSTEAAICKTERGVDTDYCPNPGVYMAWCSVRVKTSVHGVTLY